MALKILYNFTFAGGKIFEVKFDDLSDYAEKKHKFQWYLIYYDKRYDLKFNKMENDTRYFLCDGFDFVILDINNKRILLDKYEGDIW